MGWRRATFKDQTVWVEVDADGRPAVDGGRVPIRYQATEGSKVYRAGASRVTVDEGAPIETFEPGTPVANRAKNPKTGGSPPPPGGPADGSGRTGRGSGFGKAGTRTAAQAAMAADAARRKIEALRGQAIIAFSDGACRGNPGEAGSGAVVELTDGRRWEASQHLGRATNNIAELTAIALVLDLLEAGGVSADRPVVIFSDSSYANGVLVKNWKAKANQALIADLRERLSAWSDLRVVWVAGHVGIEGNERADELANRGVAGVTERTLS